MNDDLDLVNIKDAIDKLQNDDSYNAIGKLNLAAWLGERTHFLVAEIEKLRQGRPDLLAALEEMLQHLCCCCKRLNPQHTDCTWCQATEQARAVLADCGAEMEG